MTQQYHADCISCGVEDEFAVAAELQEAIIAGDIGEYICSKCLEGDQGMAYKSKIIFLDPGHGGSSIGASGNGLVEKEINLSFAQRLKRKFAAYDCEVLLTRTDDSRVSLSERVAIANNNNADLFLSIHSNGASSSRANGYEDYIHTSPFQTTIDYRDIIHRHTAAVWLEAGRANRGKKRADFFVLRETNMSAILVENGFLTNATDANLLKDWSFTEDLLDAMVAGTVEALDIPRKPVVPEKLYRVQAGAFSTRERAEEQVMRLNEAGFEAFIIYP